MPKIKVYLDNCAYNRPYDAAVYSQCDCFITTDRKILNKKIDGVAVVNPLVFVEEYLA